MSASLKTRRLAKAHVGITLLAAGLFTLQSAPGVRAEETDAASPDVVVDVTAQSPEDALGSLAAQYGFTIERSGPRAEADLVTGHFEGPLDDVVSRVLSDENHLIHHEAGKSARIAKIVLLGLSAKTPVSGSSPGSPSPEAPSMAPAPIAMAVIAPEPAAQTGSLQSALPQKALAEGAARQSPVVQQKPRTRTSLRSRRAIRVVN